MRNCLLSTLTYFDMFHYPLTADELYAFCAKAVDRQKLEVELSEMVSEQLIFHTDRFYSLCPGNQLAERRIKGNKAAISQLQIASKIAWLISLFPYVRGVGISGSLSKNFADESSDIDFFIITAKDRLWISRTILMLFRKIWVPFGKGKWFCMNYWVDEAGIEIVEKNIFTAIEIATLVPMCGEKTFEDFFAANEWTRNYLPNYVVNNKFLRVKNNWLMKRLLETVFDLPIFNKLERRLMLITGKRYKKKTEDGQLNKKGILIGMQASERYSKHNPQNFQFVLLKRYEQKLNDLLQKVSKHAAIF